MVELPLAEGSPVKVGDIIARFEVPSRVAAIHAAELEIALVLTRADAARARVTQLTSLVAQGLAARVDLDTCLLYTSDAADERSSVDLGGRRIIKKNKICHHRCCCSHNKLDTVIKFEHATATNQATD